MSEEKKPTVDFLTRDEIDKLKETDEFKAAINAIDHLPADWLSHILMLHGYIHQDAVALGASVRGTTWLQNNRPGDIALPEITGCVLANVVMWSDLGLDDIFKLDRATLEDMAIKSFREQDITDKKTREFLRLERAKLMAEAGFVMADKDWDKTVH